jgi:hypothetical protein
MRTEVLPNRPDPTSHNLQQIVFISTLQPLHLHIFKYYGKHYNIMEQRQVAFQKTKEQRGGLTLSDISPNWAKRLGDQQQLPVPLSITWLRWYFDPKRASKCIVGEAYGYSSSFVYDCKECDDIGWRFMLYFAVHSFSKLKENTQRFVDHWNKEHA